MLAKSVHHHPFPVWHRSTIITTLCYRVRCPSLSHGLTEDFESVCLELIFWVLLMANAESCVDEDNCKLSCRIFYHCTSPDLSKDIWIGHSHVSAMHAVKTLFHSYGHYPNLFLFYPQYSNNILVQRKDNFSLTNL